MTIHVREKPPLRHTSEVISPTGRRYRWADDEPRPENVPGGLKHSSAMPGGFEALDVTLPRKPDVDYSDLDRFSTIRVLDATNHVVAEDRIERIPSVSGDRMAVTPSAVGWKAHLEDDKTVRLLIIDRELSRWGGLSRQRRVNVGAGYNPQNDAAVTPDSTSGLPALKFEISGHIDGASGGFAEAWFDAGESNLIGSLFLASQDRRNMASSTWRFQVDAADTDTYTNAIAVLGDQDANAVAYQQLTLSAPKRWLRMITIYDATYTGDENERWRMVDHIAVVGNHNLALTGPPLEEGFLASDAIPYALARWAPALNVTTESIERSNFPIPQGAFYDSTTLSEIIRQLTRFELQDWAIWENQTFWLYSRGRGPTRRWRARTGPAQLEETGPQADRVWNSVLVQYQNGGTTRTVGPPGSSAGTESGELVDLDPENPANQRGLPRRALLQMGTGTAAGAIEIGRRFLSEQKLLDNSGRAQIVGHIEDDRGILHPYSHVRAGDEISFVDARDTSYRRIVKSSHDHDARTCSIDLDSPPDGLAALLERLGVALVSLGL